MATQEDIDAMKAALQARRTGKAVASISAGGRSVSYAQTTTEELEAAIEKAEAELAGKPRRGFIKPLFG